MNNNNINSEAAQNEAAQGELIHVPKNNVRSYFSRLFFAVFILAAVNFGVQLVAAYVFAYLFPWIYNTWWFTWILSVIPLYCIALPIFICVLPKHEFTLPKAQTLTFSKVLLTLVLALATMTLFNYVSFYLVDILRVISQDRLFGYDSLNETISSSPLWATILIACVLGPIGEEFIFRKLIIDKTLPFGQLASCLISGIIFGLFHGNLRQAIYAAPLGMLLAYVYVRTRNLIYPIIMHMAVNICGTVIVPELVEYATPGVEALANNTITLESIFSLLIFIGIFAVGGAILIGGIVAFIILLCKKKIRFSKGIVVTDEKLRPIVCKAPGAIAMVVLFAAMIIRSALL